MSVKKNNKGKYKKTTSEAQQYRNALSESSDSPEETVPSHNPSLIGTADKIIEEATIQIQEPIKRKPFKYKLKDWFRDNFIPTLLTTILISGIGTGVGIIWGQAKAIVRIEQRIDDLEKRLESIEIEYVDRDSLEMKLREMELTVENADLTTIYEIRLELDRIENKINSIER